MQHAYREDIEYYDDRAQGLLASAQDGTAGAVAAFARYDAPLTPDGARTVVAREHGAESWPALERHVAGLRDSGEPFARAYRAIEAHDVDGLAALVDEQPDLVAAQGTNGNDLLGMAGATCDERLVAVLLERGADVTRGNAHGWTPLHQAAYSNLPLLARMLLDAGARVDVSARGDGGTPLIVALFWGNRDTAELLAEHGVHPRNLRAAAGLGRLELATSPARTAASTGRTAASRPGSRPTIRRRCSTRRSPGPRATTVPTRWPSSSSAARPSTPTSTAAPRSRGRRPVVASRRSSASSPSAPTRAGGRASAVPNTVPAAPRCTSRRRTATWPRSARCSTSAPTRRSATASTAARPPTGRPTAGMSTPAPCLPPDSVRDSLHAVVVAVASSTLTDTHPKGGDVRSLLRRGPLAALAIAALLAPPAAAHGHHGKRLDKIRHFVVVYQENHSFDNLYGGWEGVDGIADAPTARTTQVSQAGTPFQCLLQNDVNLTSPPLTPDVHEHEPGVRQPLHERAVPDR